jgi:hypothetical protein
MGDSCRESFATVKDEVYQLLLSAFCYIQKYGRLGERLKTESRAFLLEEIVALRLISNGIVLHLCALDDDDGTWSLRSFRRERLKKTKNASQVRALNDMMNKYRLHLNALKTKHRNAYIAHRNEIEYPAPMDLLDYDTGLRSQIAEAVKVFEALWGDSVYFGFKLGSQEGTIDLKAELGISSTPV